MSHKFVPQRHIERTRGQLLRHAAQDAGPRASLVGLVLGAAVVVFAVALFVPELVYEDTTGLQAKDRVTAAADLRSSLLGLVTGLAILGGLIYTARNASVTRSGHITDRFSKAIEQLGNGNEDVRIGALYSLERIARDSPADAITVLDMLRRFVLSRTPDVVEDGAEQEDTDGEAVPRASADYATHRITNTDGPMRSDVCVALEIIARRPHTHREEIRLSFYGRGLDQLILRRAKLRFADLCFASMQSGELVEADMRSAMLVSANLTDISLRIADLRDCAAMDAVLEGAILSGARLEEADLSRANLNAAKFAGVKDRKTGKYKGTPPASLDGASMAGATMQGANLCGVDLRRVVGLTQGQIETAKTDDETQVPPGLRLPSSSAQPPGGH